MQRAFAPSRQSIREYAKRAMAFVVFFQRHIPTAGTDRAKSHSMSTRTSALPILRISPMGLSKWTLWMALLMMPCPTANTV